MKSVKGIIVAMLALVLTMSGCDIYCSCEDSDTKLNGIRYDEVMILYSDGFNSLSNYLREDILDLKEGWLPEKKAKKALVVVSSLPSAKSDYRTLTDPVLIRMYQGKNGAVMDTLKTYHGSMLSDASDMREIMLDVQKRFRSHHYGLVMSSHATGWLPEGYYADPGKYDGTSSGSGWFKPRTGWNGHHPGVVPEVEEFPGAPMVKSFGSTCRIEDGTTVSYEIEITDLAAKAIPFHLDYLIADACLMGGIEVAYELKDVTDIIAFSQAEVMAEGLDYRTLASRLLEGDEPDVVGVADDYYAQYEQKTGVNKSATISVVDCRKLEPLAAVCRSLFSRYREALAKIRPETVQGYYRSYHHWFYDLEDILVKAGISETELTQLRDAIDGCMLYKNATEQFMGAIFGGFNIDTFSGFSMYLPAHGSNFLDNFYKGLAWNKATELVD